MTLRMYSDRKGLDLGSIKVDVIHNKVHAVDCEDCTQSIKDSGGKIDQFHRVITVNSTLDDAAKNKILEIADKCPVHKTLHQSSHIKTSIG
jgi:putative redox protein